MRRVLASIGALAVLILGSGGPGVFAQEETFVAEGEPAIAASGEPAVAPVPGEERVTLRVGDVFEIAAETGVEGATTSWILTQSRTFIQASREKLFRYRFIQDDTYVLRADVMLPTGERVQRTFVLVVQPASGQTIPPPPAAGTGAALAGSVPSADSNGRVVLPSGSQLVELVPLRVDVSPLALDLDPARDSDGDGNPGNDIDDKDTYFHSYGKPLWVWFVRPLTQTEFVITGIPQGAPALVQRIPVLSEETARGTGVLTSAVSIRVEQIDAATFGFLPELVTSVADDTPLLYEWEFGDGSKSLENHPVYTYATGGDYTVKLQVRDLQTGNTIGKTDVLVTAAIEGPPTDSGSVTPNPDDTPPPDEEPVQNGTPIPWGRYALIGGLFIVSLLAGVAIVWLLSFLRRSRRLEETLESMEKEIVPEAGKTPPPLAIKSKASASAQATADRSAAAPVSKPVPEKVPATAAQQKVIDAEISASTPSKAPAPTVTEAAAPDWLKKGLAADAPKSTPVAAPAPKPAPAPVTPPPAPKPAPVPPATPKPQPVVPAAPKPQPVVPPAPVTPPAPKPAVPPAPKPVAPPTPVVPPAAPKPVTPPPAPAPITPPAPKPATPPAPVTPTTPAPATEASRLPQWLTPAPAAPAPTAPATPPAPAPKPVQPTPPPQTPMQPIPPADKPATPKNPSTSSGQADKGKDDDHPIAFVRADNIGPGPVK